ncbi:hypothetical protein GCM10007879_21950 [Maritalea porphyrae]|uniref:DUF3168 domain-containing protein n=2 Tax=Maritalea porphyrae TaxID=880732 RepID=A0ABQ5UU70_9HYPH|nr:hypothetical protein GCM10007879_21950 [Maritalea porphyrae]
MNEAMKQLQTALVSALKADSELTASIGTNRVFDSPGKGLRPPYIVVGRHDCQRQLAQDLFISSHVLDWHIWLDKPHRCEGFDIAARLWTALEAVTIVGGNMKLIQTAHTRTESTIVPSNGWTRVLVQTQFRIENN